MLAGCMAIPTRLSPERSRASRTAITSRPHMRVRRLRRARLGPIPSFQPWSISTTSLGNYVVTSNEVDEQQHVGELGPVPWATDVLTHFVSPRQPEAVSVARDSNARSSALTSVSLSRTLRSIPSPTARMFLNSSLCEGRPMAHQWPSLPRPESQETSSAPRLDAKLGSPVTPPELEALRLLDTLRDAVPAGRSDLDAQLHE